jgi:hypothetical protein
MTQSASKAASHLIRRAAKDAPRIAADLAARHAAQAATALMFGGERSETAAPALEAIRLLTAGEGGGVPKVYGRGRVGGQIIWTGEVQEATTTIRSVEGAKGFRRATEEETTEARYSLSLAIALCAGPLTRIARVWADGRLITLGDFDYRIHHGAEDQTPDPLIEAAIGGPAPAYRGLSYIVFDSLPLAPFGNRVPQFNFEIECPCGERREHDLEEAVRAVTIIPGSGEGVYAFETLHDERDEGVTKAVNRTNGLGLTDAEASFDHMTAVLPNTEAASLVVSWFGTDLRAGSCEVLPGVESRERKLMPTEWSVGGYDRASARLVSQKDGRPVYGGTPSDSEVTAAIRALKARGLSVMFHPFILMDVPQGNGLPDPYGTNEQAAFPWRGRITGTDPALAADDAASFFASYGKMVVHYATLCREAGGVDAFLLGSELRGLTRLRAADGSYPAIGHLIALAEEVRAILPDTKLSYGADWTEYGSHVPEGEPGGLAWPLDPLWAHPAIDFIGIDNYFPLSDWREGINHRDAQESSGPYDQAYLEGRIASGESYDWYYADLAERETQTRRPITDGLHGEPWVYRPKDLWSWWASTHHPREAGSRLAATPWQPQSKPIWFTELGCPAIDKGPNQPNVFVDPKSSESAPPYHSTGARDDRAQRAFLEAHHRFWSDPVNNPVSALTGERMVDARRLFVYAWDARPWPEFPVRSDVWADAENWLTGHWLNGRAGRIPLGRLIETVARDAGLLAVDASACDRLVSGMSVTGPLSPREVLEPLLALFQLDATDREGLLIVRPRTGRAEERISEKDLALADDGPPLLLDRLQDTERPAALSITFADELSGFDLKTIETRDETATGGMTLRIATSVVLEQGEALARGRSLLAEARAAQDRAAFALPETRMAVEPGSVLNVAREEGEVILRVASTEDEGGLRRMDGHSTDPGAFAEMPAVLMADPETPPVTAGAPAFEVMDLPIPDAGDGGARLFLTAFAEPWPGAVAFHRGSGSDAPLIASLPRQSIMGRLTEALGPGHAARWDRANTLKLRLHGGHLSSRPEAEILGGAHLAAVGTAEGWELLQFASAILGDDGTYRLSGLLRGRFGTEAAALTGASAGARFVLLGQEEALPLTPDFWGQKTVWQAGPEGSLPGAYPFRSRAITARGLGAKPLAPVHLRAERDADSTLFRWTRRTRIGGEHFGPGDVPLGETEERYHLVFQDVNGDVMGEGVSDRPEYRHVGPAPARMAVRQWSSVFGEGQAAFLTL